MKNLEKNNAKVLITFAFFILAQFVFSAENKTIDEEQNRQQKIVAGQFVVKFKKSGNRKAVNQKALGQVMTKYNITKSDKAFNKASNIRIKEKLNLHNVFIMNTSENIMQVVAELNKNPEVEYAEPVYLDKIDGIAPNDSLYSQQVYLSQVAAADAWEIQYGNPNVIIGVIDTGVDWDHEDLKNVIYRNEAETESNGIDDDDNGFIDDVRGWDWVTGVSGSEPEDANPNEDGEEEDNNPMDFNGHGTGVAGIAAAHTNNETGIASVSSGARVLPLRCGWQANNGLGYINSIWAAQAYIYAADMGAAIVNQSSGNSGQLIVDGAYYAFLNGTLIIESAGNDNSIAPSVLGDQPWVISVAAVTSSDEKASYSSYGDYVKVSAPGNSLLSTSPDNLYTYHSGTSFAAPLVASVAGLVKAYEPEIGVIDLFERIVKSSDDIDALNPEYSGLLGSGRLNAYRAMTEEFTALPNFSIVSSTIIEPSPKNIKGILIPNGQLDPGEDVVYQITLRNTWQDAENVSISLVADNNWPLQVQSEPVFVGHVGGVQDTNSWQAIASFSISCAANAYPQSVKLSIIVTADGFEQQLESYISISPKVLLVSDFDGTHGSFLDFTSYYVNSLTKNRIPFDQVYHSEITIDADLLSNYNIVIWGCEPVFTSLESKDRAALSSFLNNGGALFLSGQDIGWDLADPTELYINEYDNSLGESLTFYNEYLKSDYIADDANTRIIYGIDDNPITDGLSVDFFQTKRAVTNQFPDIISPLDGAVSILKYGNGSTGAISYSEDYRLVYFAFGGFESVTNSLLRDILMDRIVDFLDGIDIWHKPKDSEQATDDYIIDLNISLDAGEVDSVFLYWDTGDEFPYNVVAMSDMGDNYYSGIIPAQELSTTVNYFFYIKTSNNNYSVTKEFEFNVGPDSEKPQIKLLNEPYWTSINAFGVYPYLLKVRLSDNLGIDTSTAKIHYWIGNEAPEINELFKLHRDEYAGSFEFSEALDIASIVSFYFSVSDASLAHNETVSDTFSYIIDSVQILDDFEKENQRWDYGDGWERSTVFSKFGSGSITDSPRGNYDNNVENALTFKVPFNLTSYKFAEFSFWIKSSLETGNTDSLIAEASNNYGESWTLLSSHASSGFLFRNSTTDISSFTGEGNEEVWIRFKLKSDSANTFDGVYIDNPMIRVSTSPVTSINNQFTEIPLVFDLKQNYPNPFNPATTIEYHIAENSKVTLSVFNVLGQRIKELVSNGLHTPGKYRLDWDAGKDLASGVYIYQLKAVTARGMSKTFTKKLLLLK